MPSTKRRDSAATLYEAQLRAAHAETLRSELRRVAEIALGRGPNDRYHWAQLGMTLRERDGAVAELVNAGLAQIGFSPNSRNPVLRLTDVRLTQCKRRP